jgi:steroid delta-isomerase-like uncharacterized protein
MDQDGMKEIIVKCMTQGFNSGNLEALNELFHQDYKRHSHVGHPSVNNLDEHKAELAKRRETFKDAKFVIDEMIAEGNTVAVRFTTTGVHAGEYLGIPGTGKRIERQSCAFFHFRDGKIASSSVVTDVYGTLQQLGSTPVTV